MKLLNLNAGIKISNTDKIIDFIHEQQADFIALQEVGRPLEPSVASEYRSQADIQEGLKADYPFSFYGPLWLGDAFRSNGHVKLHFGGHIEQGNQILSKFPIISATNEHYYKHYEYMLDWSNWKQEDHGRAVQITEFVVNGKPLQILNLHGIWNKTRLGDERTLAQCHYLVSAAHRKNIPTIIAGDFNLKPDSESIQYMNQHFRNLVTDYGFTSTRPGFEEKPDKRIVDYIFVNDQITVNHFDVIKTEISDHFPLIAEFEITN